MIRTLFAFLLYLFVCYSAIAQSFEAKVYTELEASFAEEGKDLNEILATYESILIENKILKDTSALSRRMFVHIGGQSEEIGRILPIDEQALELQLTLSMNHLEKAISSVSASDSKVFSQSSLAKIFNSIYANQPYERTHPKNVRDALGRLKQEDWEHPFYRALTLFFSANFSDLHFDSNDQLWESESNYERLKPNLEIEMRNILTLKINAAGQLLIQGMRVDKPEGISHFVERFYTTNRGLTFDEVKEGIKDPSYKGYNYPFFSNNDLESINEEIEKKRNSMLAEIEKELPDWKHLRTLCNMEEFWIFRRRILSLTGVKFYQEIHPAAHIRIESQKGESSDDILEELAIITNTVTRLRDEESLLVFGESYDDILARQNFFLNDVLKLRYLESQFPILILVNPHKSGRTAPPPVEVITSPPPSEEIKTPPPPPADEN